MSASEAPRKPIAIDRIPPAPREPSPRARRLIFGYQGSQWVLLLVGGIFLLIGVIFTIVFCWGLPGDIAIALTGKRADGFVRAAEIDGSARVNGRHPTRVRVEYEVLGHRYEAESSTIDDALIAGARPGARVDVEYAAAKPEWGRLAGTTRSFFGYFGLFVLIFPAIGGALAFAAVRSNRREIHAFTHGEPVLARVVYAGPDTSTKINGRHPFKIDWEFKRDEAVYTGSISSMAMLDLEEFLEAKEVPVLCDMYDPSVNTIYVE